MDTVSHHYCIPLRFHPNMHKKCIVVSHIGILPCVVSHYVVAVVTGGCTGLQAVPRAALIEAPNSTLQAAVDGDVPAW